MRNLFKQMRALLAPEQPLQVGTVVAVQTGTVTVELPGGGRMQARGEGWLIGDPVYVRAGVVEGPAPDLPVVLIDV